MSGMSSRWRSSDVEPIAPCGAVRREPLVDLAQRLGTQPVDAALRVHPHVDDAGLAQHPQVLRHRRLADAERGDKVADRPILLAQQIEDAPPVRLSEHVEHPTSMPVELYSCQRICVYQTSLFGGRMRR